MSSKKKVVVTKTKPKAKLQSKEAVQSHNLIFGRKNYMLIGLCLLLMMIGFLLMSGGNMPSPDVWEEDIIYSFRRITLAPIVILAGLGVGIYAIFKK